MLNPITAVTDVNPYPYYSELVRNRPFYFDRELSLWVASSAEIVKSILADEAFSVRPENEPVPGFLVGTTAGQIFKKLVRMNDGALHCPLKAAVSVSFEQIDITRVSAESEKWAEKLFEAFYDANDSGWLTRFAFHLPVFTMASLLGISEGCLGEIEKLTGAFSRCLAPGAADEEIAKGKAAAELLYKKFEKISLQSFEEKSDLFSLINENLRDAGVQSPETAIANCIGLLFQTYEATAGLIGNSLINLARHPQILEQIKAAPPLAANLVNEVNRFDPSVQNTRRFVTADMQLAGENLKSGDSILVLLAAANRDSKVNPNPAEFNIFRKHICSFTFGSSRHACPGQLIATKIAETGIRKLVSTVGEIAGLTKDFNYRKSANIRIPLF